MDTYLGVLLTALCMTAIMTGAASPEDTPTDLAPVEEAMDAPPEGSLKVDVQAGDNSLKAELQSLDLATAQRRALADNPSLQAAAERVEQTRQLVWQARSLYWPQIDLTYTWTYTWLPDAYTDPINEYLDQGEDLIQELKKALTRAAATRLPTASQRHTVRTWAQTSEDLIDEARELINDPLESATLTMTAGYLVFDGFSRKFTNAMAKHGYKEAQAAEREGRRILLDAVAQAYFGVQLAREQVAIAEADIAFNERLLREAAVRRKAGRAATSDVLNFEVLLRAARGSLLKARRDYETARIALALLMGMPGGVLPEDIAVADLRNETPADMDAPNADAMIAQALAHRPDLEQ
ncbi:MAG TPA: TolC family protein, partial [Candidatus Hydrogenedentes bacterium]|nr:TolC family protein [Candidatus Hydrogenedentota bacterium]